MKVEEFFYATLRAYIDMNGNWFPDLEEKVHAFKEENDLDERSGSLKRFFAISSLKEFLTLKYGYKINEVDFKTFPKAVQTLRFFSGGKSFPILYLNAALSNREKTFILIKEIAHRYLKHETRLQSSPQHQIDSFESVFNNFRASYFSSALLIPKDSFLQRLDAFFMTQKWDPAHLLDWVREYPGTYESFFHRLSQILPKFYGLNHIFFLTFRYDPRHKSFKLTRELHLSELHSPRPAKTNENYCRRWITTKLLQQLHAENKKHLVGIQKSSFFGSDNEYLNFSLAHADELDPEKKVCVTLGVLVTPELKKQIQFADDLAIPKHQVADTCEQCGIADCQERVAPASLLEEKRNEDFVQEWVESTLEKSESTPKYSDREQMD